MTLESLTSEIEFDVCTIIRLFVDQLHIFVCPLVVTMSQF